MSEPTGIEAEVCADIAKRQYFEMRAALGIPEDASHEDALKVAQSFGTFTTINFPAILDVPKFHDAWKRWLQHRREKKLPSYKPTGLQNQFTRLSEMGAAKAILAIEFSISQNYQGIFPDRDGTSQKHHQGTARASQVIGTQDRYRVGPGVHGDQR